MKANPHLPGNDLDVTHIRLSPAGSGRLILLLTMLLAAQPIPLRAQPLSDETMTHLIRAALISYFDTSSTFAISTTNARVSGDALLIDDLTITGRPAVLHGVRGDLLLQASELELQAGALYQQEIRVRRVRKATLVATSTAAAMAQALARASPSILDPQVRFHAGEFAVTATVRREGKLYPTQARGKLVVAQGVRVLVTVTGMKVSGGDVSQAAIEKELLKINPVLDLSRYPLDLRVRRLTLHNDRVQLLAVSGR